MWEVIQDATYSNSANTYLIGAQGIGLKLIVLKLLKALFITGIVNIIAFSTERVLTAASLANQYIRLFFIVCILLCVMMRCFVRQQANLSNIKSI